MNRKKKIDKCLYCIIALTVCFTLLSSVNVYAQNNNTKTWYDPAYTTPPPDSIVVHIHADTMPKFPGNMFKYISDSLQNPPKMKEYKKLKTIYIDCIIERDGSISHMKVIQSRDTVLNKEAIRVVSSMPKWHPGIQNGKPVRVQTVIPVNFNLSPASGGVMKK